MSKPILPATLDLTDIQIYFGRPSTTTAHYVRTFGIRLYNFTGSNSSEQAATVLWGLRNITELLAAIHEGTQLIDTPLASDIQFTDRVEVLERLVHQLWYVDGSETPQHAVLRTFGWTCLIYIYTTLRELPKELGMNMMLANRVKKALDGSPDLDVLLATFQDLLLWQMFICGRVADPRDKPFFAHQAARILMVRKLEHDNAILTAAEGFLWPERVDALAL